MDLSRLKPYHGYQSSFIPFSSGYYLYLASWDSTPTRFPSFSNLWVIRPDDHRILFADPAESSQIVCIYHKFDEIFGASISLDWSSQNDLQVQCVSDDGSYSINMELELRTTRASRLLVALGGGPPNPITVSKPVSALLNFMVNLLVAKGGMRIVGKTETGQPFYNGATERLMLVQRGSAVSNAKELGHVTSPTWPVEFGDSVSSVQAVLKLGTLFIPYEEELEDDRCLSR